MQLHEEKQFDRAYHVAALNSLFYVTFIKSQTDQLNHLKSYDNHYNNSIFLALYLLAAIL